MLFNLFIVRSPLQLINAMEAKAYFNTKNNILLLTVNSQIDMKQFDAIMNLSDWDKVIHYQPRDVGSTFFEQIRFIPTMKTRKYQYIFSGDYGTINQILMANLQADEYYLMDDGTMTIETHKKLLNPKKVSFSKRFKLLRYPLFGLKSNLTKPLNFYTCYSLKQIGNEKIIANNYTFITSLFTLDKRSKGTIYLLGQNIDNKWMKSNSYVTYIKKLKEQYCNYKIIYFPHRLEIISDDLQQLFDDQLLLQYNDIPIEVYFLEKNIYPNHIISFTSSALFNLKKIYSDATVEAIYIEQDDLLTHQDFVLSCYDFFKQASIQLIKL